MSEETRLRRVFMALVDWRRRDALAKCLGNDLQCGAAVIRSHSIQCGFILKQLSADGHVYVFEHELDGVVRLTRKGIRRASTFSGFCAAHDQSIFRRIDFSNERTFDSESVEQILLLSLRAISREFWAKLNNQASLRRLADLTRQRDVAGIMALFNCDDSVARTVILRASDIGLFREGTTWSTERTRRSFFSLSRQLENQKYHLTVRQVFEFPNRTGFAAASGTTPLYDLHGKEINSLGHDRDAADLVLNAFPSNGSQWVVVTYHQRHANRLAPFLNQLIALPREEREIAISKFVVMNIENLALAPALVNELTPEKRQEVESAFQRTILDNETFTQFPEVNLFIKA
ncbi:MAG: hypothetical protein IH974_06040 [Myxococcales bacterium]|nr:hypothetical protein [Myxococcales bacterium]